MLGRSKSPLPKQLGGDRSLLLMQEGAREAASKAAVPDGSWACDDPDSDFPGNNWLCWHPALSNQSPRGVSDVIFMGDPQMQEELAQS